MKAALWWLLAITALLISIDQVHGEFCSEVWWANTPIATATPLDVVFGTKAMFPAYSNEVVFIGNETNWFFLPESEKKPMFVLNHTCKQGDMPGLDFVKNTDKCPFDSYSPNKCECDSLPQMKGYMRIGIRPLYSSVPNNCFIYAAIKVLEGESKKFQPAPIRVLPKDVEAANARLAHLKIVHPFYTTPETTTIEVTMTTATSLLLTASTTESAAKVATAKIAKTEVIILVACFFTALLIGLLIVGIVVGIDRMLIRIGRNETTRLTSASKGSATLATGKLPSEMKNPDTMGKTTAEETVDKTVDKTKDNASMKSMKAYNPLKTT